MRGVRDAAPWRKEAAALCGAVRHGATTMDAIPIKAFLDLVTRGIATPRPVARHVIDRADDMRTRLELLLLAAAIQSLLWSFLVLIAPGIFGGVFAGGIGLFGHAALAGLVLVNYVMVTTIAYAVGRRVGGTGTPAQVGAAAAWHAVLTASLTPLQIAALGGAAPGQPAVAGPSVMFALLYAGLNVWLMAACMAEAHGFRSTGKVAVATIGLFFLAGIVISLFARIIAGA